MKRNQALPIYALILLFIGFAAGVIMSRDMRTVVSRDLQKTYLIHPGDAPAPVRAGVVAALRAFQDGYARRDPKQLDSFMQRLFAPNDEVLLLGADAAEWIRGYRPVSQFILSDWLRWGEFRFSVDDSMIWSSGDVAWIASAGTVHTRRSDRPIRFSAVLTRNGDAWIFRQVHFQWDERDPGGWDLVHPTTLAGPFLTVWHYLHAPAIKQPSI